MQFAAPCLPEGGRASRRSDTLRCRSTYQKCCWCLGKAGEGGFAHVLLCAFQGPTRSTLTKPPAIQGASGIDYETLTNSLDLFNATNGVRSVMNSPL